MSNSCACGGVPYALQQLRFIRFGVFFLSQTVLFIDMLVQCNHEPPKTLQNTGGGQSKWTSDPGPN